MIQICVLRVAICELCCSDKVLWPWEEYPEKCWECGSKNWMYGPPSAIVQKRRYGQIPKEKVVVDGQTGNDIAG